MALNPLLLKNRRCFLFTLFLSVFLFGGRLCARAQLSKWYEPGIAVSSDLNFSDNLAHESALWIRNSIRPVDCFYICLNLGYAHRSYSLDYLSPTIGEFSGNLFRNAFVIQPGFEYRFQNIRKLRKTLHPFIGLYLQRQFFKVPDKDKNAREYFQVDKIPFAVRQGVLEVGTEFVTKKWPRFYFSVQVEPSFLSKGFGIEKVRTENENQDDTYFYFHVKEQSCCRLLLGIRL